MEAKAVVLPLPWVERLLLIDREGSDEEKLAFLRELAGFAMNDAQPAASLYREGLRNGWHMADREYERALADAEQRVREAERLELYPEYQMYWGEGE